MTLRNLGTSIMWIFTKYGFYSAVCARKDEGFGNVDENTIMVRARSKKHIDSLKKKFTELDGSVLETPHNDYRYRIFVPKDTWSRVFAELALDTDYDNFKDKVKEYSGEYPYLNSLGKVWNVMYDYQTRNE